jgi:hypothetical protein
MDADDDRWFDRHYCDDGLTAAQLAEIEARAAAAVAHDSWIALREMTNDVPALLAEVRRLRALINQYDIDANDE